MLKASLREIFPKKYKVGNEHSMSTLSDRSSAGLVVIIQKKGQQFKICG